MNEAQFTESYNLYADAIFRHCFTYAKDREIAKDLTQETFIKTWDYIVKGGKVESMKTFLYRTARNTSIDWYRKRKTESLDSLHEAGFDVATGEHERTPAIADGARALEQMKQLSPEHQEVLTMRFVDDLTPTEIGEILGESDNTVSQRINRAMKKLREIYI